MMRSLTALTSQLLQAGWRRMHHSGVNVAGRSCITSAEPHADGLVVRWQDGSAARFSFRWLRDHSPASFHESSGQRMIDSVLIPGSIRPKEVAAQTDGVRLRWADDPFEPDHESKYRGQWLYQHAYCWLRRPDESASALHLASDAKGDVQLWDQGLAERIPVASYRSMVQGGEEGLLEGLALFNRYGMLLITDTPPTMEATEAFARRVGVVRNTFYGAMWDTAPVADKPVDTAYTNIELKPHTDCTYLLDPPGVQIFNCAAQSSSGGSTWLVDGFTAAQRLKEASPEAYDFFLRAAIPWYHRDQNGIHMLVHQPVLRHNFGGMLTQVRVNNDDRGPLCTLSAEDVDAFYRHMDKFVGILRSKELGLLHTLQVGHMLMVNNHRVLHGRKSFVGFRNLLGCYINREDVESTMRRVGVDGIRP